MLCAFCRRVRPAVSGTRRPRGSRPTKTGAQLAAVVNMADPKSSVQLLKGFHDVEQNAWRWTMGKFSVTLRPPLNAPQKGATLVVKLSIPDASWTR